MKKVVALGGGHGLAASLTALRRITPLITAIVTVADNGGSSGRLRQEFNSLPPGDLRMALAALCADDDWGRSWAEIMQYRFTSQGEMNSHALGNLLLTALWDRDGDAVAGIERVGDLLKITGRVLPMALEPLDIEGVFESDGRDNLIRGQVEVATAKGNLKSLRLIPANPKYPIQARDAIQNADYLTFGPGSWFSSVMPHLLLKEQLESIINSRAKKIMIFNLPEDAMAGEFAGSSLADHLKLVKTHAPDLRIDFAIADSSAVSEGEFAELISNMGGELLLGDYSSENGQNHHDIEKLATTFSHIFG